jgi:peptide/nickel transport system permease protein
MSVETAAVTESAGEDPRRGRDALHFAVRNPKLLAGLSVLVVLVLVAIIGPFFVHDRPNEYIGPQYSPPSADHWFGTTSFGQDVFTQFVHGLRSTFTVGALGGGIAAVLGMLIGFTAGYRGGWVDEILNMITNIVLVLPALVVLIIAAAYLQARGLMVQSLFIGLTTWPWAARAIRAQTFSLAGREFVDLARLSGRRSWRIILREVAPNMYSYLFMSFILLFGGAILIAAGLDFIGLGPTEGISLGLMMHYSVTWGALHLGTWWWFLPPGLGITAVVGSLYITNVGLDEVFNPRLREL